MNSDEQAIRELVATWFKATRQGDLDTVLDLMTEDVVFLTAGHAPMRGRDAYEASARGGIGSGTIDASSVIDEIRILGEWAWMWTTLTVTMTPTGSAPVNRAGNTLSILRKEGGRWRIARDANMLAIVPK